MTVTNAVRTIPVWTDTQHRARTQDEREDLAVSFTVRGLHLPDLRYSLSLLVFPGADAELVRILARDIASVSQTAWCAP
jgi:hypothetical protein